MKFLNQQIETKLKDDGIDFLRFVDISHLAEKQTRGLPYAILIGIAINPTFIKDVRNDPNYIHTLEDEYAQTENRVGEVADQLAEYLTAKGYKALSQSDAGLLAEGTFDFETKKSVLPHKTVAVLSGLGWIGKNNLFITAKYGAAQCLGTVLTDAPLDATQHEAFLPKCGSCNICSDICEENVLKGRIWNTTISRDEIIDVYKCTTCLKCLVHCPWTRRFTESKNL